jgi:hypothetical protein
MHREDGLSRDLLFHGGNVQCDRVRIRFADGSGSATTNGAAA